MITLTITVEIDPRDCPEPRARIAGHKSSIIEATRHSVEEALAVAWPSHRYPLVTDDAAYKRPRITSVRGRTQGPRDTFKGG